MEDQEDDTPQLGGGGPARPGGGGGGGRTRPGGGGGGGASARTSAAASATAVVTAKTDTFHDPPKMGTATTGVAAKTTSAIDDGKIATAVDGGDARKMATAGGAPNTATSSTAQANGGDLALESEETIKPWRSFNASAYKPAPPGPICTITAPRRSAPGPEMWRTTTTRGEVSIAAEFEKLSKSFATVGGGLAKVFSGFGLKFVDPEEKERKAAEERKKAEEKKVAEERRAAEESIILANMKPVEAEKRMKKKEEEEKMKKEEEEKDRKINILLSVPGNIVNISTVIDGLGEIAFGSRDAVTAMSLIIPCLVKRVRGAANSSAGSSSSSAQCCTMGTASLGLRMALDRQVLTRAYDGRVSVVDTFGARKERVPRALGGTVVLKSESELNETISDFRRGKLSQMIDVDENSVSLITALEMWKVLCSEQLTGLLRPDSVLPEMALRGGAFIDEELAIESRLQDQENVVKEYRSQLRELRDILYSTKNGTTVKEMTKSKLKYD